jgi:hypothetical protein
MATQVLEGIPEAESEAGWDRSTPGLGTRPAQQWQHASGQPDSNDSASIEGAGGGGGDDPAAGGYRRASSSYLSGPPALGRGSTPLVPSPLGLGGPQDLGSPAAGGSSNTTGDRDMPLALTPPRAVSLSHSTVPALQAAAAEAGEQEEAAPHARPAVRDEVSEGGPGNHWDRWSACCVLGVLCR